MDIIEDLQLRNELVTKTDVLDKVKILTLIPHHMFVGTAQVANYYEVNLEAIKSIIKRHKEELERDGLYVYRDNTLKILKDENITNDNGEPYITKRCKAYTAIPKKAILRIGMLLTNSPIAEKVRDYLVAVEEISTTAQKTMALSNISNKITQSSAELEESVKKEFILIEHHLNKCKLLGIPQEEAALLVHKSLMDCKNVNKVILNTLEERYAIVHRIKRGRIRERINYIACEKNITHQEVYHLLSSKLKYEIGINFKAIRDQAKRNKSDVPSYLDLMAKYNAFEIAERILSEM